MCSCGQPKYICHNPANEGEYDVVQSVCQAERAVQSVTSAKDYKPDPGARLAAVYVRDLEKKPLPKMPPPRVVKRA